MDEIINWGFIGAGKMALNMASEFSHSKRSRVHSVWSRTKKSSMLFSLLNQRPQIFTSIEDMVNDVAVNMIYVATPNSFHFPHVKKALEAGKGVLCEKPFMLNAFQAIELQELAKANNLFLMEGMWVRFLPVIQKINQIISDGLIGDLVHIESSFNLKLNPYENERLIDLALGGGALLDLGVYPISLVCSIVGDDPLKIISNANIGNSGVDHNFSLELEYISGLSVNISAGFESENPQSTIIEGEKGSIEISADRTWKFTKIELQIFNQGSEKLVFPIVGNGFIHQIYEVESCIIGNKKQSDKMPLVDSIRVLNIMDTMREEWKMVFPGEK